MLVNWATGEFKLYEEFVEFFHCSFLLAALLHHCKAVCPLLTIKCTHFHQKKQTFCQAAVNKRSIKNDPNSICYVKYHTSCESTKFRSTHRNEEHIQEKSNNKYSEPGYWCQFTFWFSEAFKSP